MLPRNDDNSQHNSNFLRYVTPGKQTLPDDVLSPDNFIASLAHTIENKDYVACIKLLQNILPHFKKNPKYQETLATFLAKRDIKNASCFYQLSQSAPVPVISKIVELLDDATLAHLCKQCQPKGKLPLHALYNNEYLKPNPNIDKGQQDIYDRYECATLPSHEMAPDDIIDYHTLIKRYPSKVTPMMLTNKTYDHTFIEKIQVAWHAMVSVRRIIKFSTTQPHFNNATIETKNECFTRLATIRDIELVIGNEMRALTLDTHVFLRFHFLSALYKQFSAGNCYEYATLIANELLKRGVSGAIVMVHLLHGDHVLTAFKYKNNPELHEPNHWEDYLFVDAWSGQIYTYDEINHYLKDCIFYPDHQFISHHIAVPYDPNFHQIKSMLHIDPKTYQAQQMDKASITSQDQLPFTWEARRDAFLAKILEKYGELAKQTIVTLENDAIEDNDVCTVNITHVDGHYHVTKTIQDVAQHEVINVNDLIYKALRAQYELLLETDKALMMAYFNHKHTNLRLFSHHYVVDDITMDRLAFICVLVPTSSAPTHLKPYKLVMDLTNFQRYREQALNDMHHRLVDKAFFYLISHEEIYGLITSYSCIDYRMQLTLIDQQIINLSSSEVLYYAIQCEQENQEEFCTYYFDIYLAAALNYFKYKKSQTPKIERDGANIWLSIPHHFPTLLTIGDLKRYALEGETLTVDEMYACYDVKTTMINLKDKKLNDFDISTLQCILELNADISKLDLSHTNITDDQLAKLIAIKSINTIYLLGVTLSDATLSLLHAAKHLKNIVTDVPSLSNHATHPLAFFQTSSTSLPQTSHIADKNAPTNHQ